MDGDGHHHGELVQVPAAIRPEPEPPPSDREIRSCAEGQHGVLTLRQLEALGLSARAVRHRTAAGRLERVHRGVYAAGPPSPERRWSAAVLAAGPGALLSHRSAAALWDLRRDPPRTVEVTRPGHTTRSRPEIVIHSARLSADDVTARRRIPCTALPRTLIDLAAVVDGDALAQAIDRAEQLRLFDLAAVEELLGRAQGHRGAGALAAALRDYAPEPTIRSEAERRLLEAVRRAGIAEPQVNRWIPLPDGGGYEADLLWPAARLVVEIDGRAHHARRRAFAHDRRRDRRLALAGLRTVRFAATEVLDEPGRVAREIGELLAQLRSW